MPTPEALARAKQHYFGGCPECGDQDGFLNVGREHWCRCDKHLVKWFVGSNLFSGWREETREQHLANMVKLVPYRTVKSL